MSKWNALANATLDAISINLRKSEIRLSFVAVDDPVGKLMMVAEGVEDFLMHELTLFNVVERVQAFEGHESTQDGATTKKLFAMMENRYQAGLLWTALQKKHKAIHEGRLTFLELQPSCGASTLILASNIQLVRL